MTAPATATVRTFRAGDAAAALAAVKAALGPDAVILATRSVQAGFFRRPEVEVTAALEPPEPAAGAPANREARRNPERPAADGPEPAAALIEEVHTLRKAVDDTRQALALVLREARAGNELRLAPGAAELYTRLVARGVEPTLAEELVRQAAATAPPARLGEAVRDLLGERLIPCRAPWLHDRKHVVALVGPTGAGKTTTLAKMAARALLESRKRVALVTVDTYRVGACDQLARYAEIMSVPLAVARDRTELARAMDRLAHCDLVLIDTTGRADPGEIAKQGELVRSLAGVQVHLVVSAASGALDLATAAEKWRVLAPDRLIVTKLDEAAGPGGILSAAVRVARPIACVADGQRVPEDLHVLAGPELVDVVMGKRTGPRG